MRKNNELKIFIDHLHGYDDWWSFKVLISLSEEAFLEANNNEWMCGTSFIHSTFERNQFEWNGNDVTFFSMSKWRWIYEIYH